MRRALRSLAATAASLVLAGALAGAAHAATTAREIGPGAWSWFSDPRAVYHDGHHRRTYVGWISTQGSVMVASLDHDTGKRAVKGLHRSLGRDDHANPSLHVRPDGRLMVFYGRHRGSAVLFRVSRRRENIDSWGRERRLPTNSPSVTYSNPVAIGDDLYVFWRGLDHQPTFSRSANWGRRWSRPRKLLSAGRGRRPYVKYHSDGRRTIHLAFSETNPGSEATSIYYAAYRPGRGFLRAGGRRVGSLGERPLRPADADTVYDAAAEGGRAWIYDVAADRRGRPVLVYAVIRARDDHRYRYARWTGRRWVQYELARTGPLGGSDNYSPGISLDHETPSTVLLSRRVGAPRAADGRRPAQVELWSTRDGGRTWATRRLTRGSSVDHFRPITPRGLPASGRLNVFWMRGLYPGFTTYNTDIVAARGAPPR